jgi:hypothetical protein
VRKRLTEKFDRIRERFGQNGLEYTTPALGSKTPSPASTDCRISGAAQWADSLKTKFRLVLTVMNQGEIRIRIRLHQASEGGSGVEAGNGFFFENPTLQGAGSRMTAKIGLNR